MKVVRNEEVAEKKENLVNSKQLGVRVFKDAIICVQCAYM